jgi:hypothetical protein
MISDYLDSLARELDFDRSLSRDVRQEVEDHLCEAVAADPTGDIHEAERRAIANFGDARAIAAQFAVISLARRSRRAGVAAMVVIACIYVAMKARIAWYVAAQWAIGDDMRAVSALVVQIDRYAFWLAIMIGLGGFIYIRSREIPAALHPAYQRQLRRFSLACCAAAGALVVSVTSDAVLTALQWHATAQSLIPMLSMTFEFACIGVLVFHVRSLTLRAASTAALTQA